MIHEPVLSEPILAPESVEFPEEEPGLIVPAARRSADRSLAPTTIGAEPAYIPGSVSSASQLYPASEVAYGETYGDEATVRISDRTADQAGQAPPGVRPSSRICPECRFCEHGIPYHQCPHCEPDERMVRRYTRRHGVVYPPDYGWSPPANHPIDRVSIDYYRAFPAAWNGQQQPGPAVVRPTVYWPTDTTQLGFTYQQTPRWMPYPGMVPPVPHPAQWHVPQYSHQYQRGPAPHFRGNAAAPQSEHAVPQSRNLPGQPSWTPSDAPDNVVSDIASLPVGPSLNSADAPLLTPVPF